MYYIAMARYVVSLSVMPLGTQSPSVGNYVREAVKVLEERGLKVSIGAGFTDFELDDLSKLSEILADVERRLLAMGVQRIVTLVKIDARFDAPDRHSIEHKVAKASGRA